MKIYIDDNSTRAKLVELLRKAGHEMQIPRDVGMSGKSDVEHFTHAIRGARVCLTKDYDDFLALHHLIRAAQGHHPGIFVIREDNDPARDLTPKGIVTAIRKLEAAGVPIADEYVILNQWR